MRILVLDLDGTVLQPDGSVAAEECEAIQRVRDRGISVVIATGRALVESGAALETLRHDGLFIGASGSILSDVATGATLHRSTMPADVVQDAAAMFLEDGHKVLVLKDAESAGYDYLAVGSGDLDPASAWWFEHLPVRVRFLESIDDDPHPHDTLRTAVVASADELAVLAEHMRGRLGDRAFLHHWAAVTETEATGASTHLLEVFNANVNKWTMVERFCQECDVPTSAVVAIGDGLNDVELLRGAGLGIAMGNADAHVKSVANHETLSNTEHGVAHAIDRLLSGEWSVG